MQKWDILMSNNADKKMDVRNMTEFQDKSFNCVLDKGAISSTIYGLKLCAFTKT